VEPNRLCCWSDRLVVKEAVARPVVVDPWPSGGIEFAFEASPEECRGLAARFHLVAVDRLTGQARLDRIDGEMIRLHGRLQAEVVQSCVVSLEDVPATIDEPFECHFTRPDAGAAGDLAWDEDVEPLAGPELDVGEIFAQQLSLMLDPYPRAAGADALALRELGPNIAFGEQAPTGTLAAALMDKVQGAAPAAPSKQGRG
jgi:hypothetical protein